jgi:hypothetical protein
MDMKMELVPVSAKSYLSPHDRHLSTFGKQDGCVVEAIFSSAWFHSHMCGSVHFDPRISTRMAYASCRTIPARSRSHLTFVEPKQFMDRETNTKMVQRYFSAPNIALEEFPEVSSFRNIVGTIRSPLSDGLPPQIEQRKLRKRSKCARLAALKCPRAI